MKRILLSAGIIISLSAAAQDNNLVENYFNRQLKAKRAASEVAPFRDYFNSKPPDLNILPPQEQTSLAGEKVYRLPQDGMACIQPDLDQFNMPNAGAGMQMKESGAGVIPNPGNKAVTVMPRGKTTLMKKP
jgi:hypothetical protein